MFFNIQKIRRKRLITWAKEYKIDIPRDPDELAEVSHVNMSNKGIFRIPKEIDCLPNLIEINAEMNKLVELPWEFGALKKLTSINFGHNSFTDIPGVICKLSQLEHLNFESNAIKKVPSVIANMTGLKSLNISFNAIAELPSEIGHLKHLAHLDVASNQLHSLPAGFLKLYNLSSLALWNNKFTDLPELLKELPNLTSIQFEADIERINRQLVCSCMVDDHYGVERALMNGADINYKMSLNEFYSFTTAIFEAHSVEMVKLLIDQGADVNMKRQIIEHPDKGENIEESFLSKKHSSEITKYLKSVNLLK